MSTNDSVIAALEVALEATPEDFALRLHLASILLKESRASDALAHYVRVLSIEPDHTEALRGAYEAALGSGENDKAAKFKRLLDALLGSEGPKPVPAIGPQPSTHETDSLDEDEFPRRKQPNLRVIDATRQFQAEASETRITLDDVGGMNDVKRRLNVAFLGPLRNPELRKAYNISLRGGLLLYGPPGCGKTYIARALAGELRAKFFPVGINDVLDMWMGESERKLHELFEQARRNAPAVLFFDEIDALGHKRSDLRGGGIRTVVNSLLSELDGIGSDNKGLFILAATNHPWDVDSAFKRPNRFDRLLLVLPPDQEARLAMLERELRQKPTEKLDLAWLAKKTEGFSGADISHLCNSATELALEESLDTGNIRPLRMSDFKTALQEVQPSVGSWFSTAKNYAMFANEGGAYDELLDYIKAKQY